MTNERKPIPCPECDREKYFEGLCYWCKCRKERERYQAMTEVEIENTIDKIIKKIETIEKWEEVYKDFRGLLAYHDINTMKIANAAFQKNIFYPPTLYRNASEDVQDRLIEMLLKPNCKEANHILCCLAVCGSERVRKVFFELERNPLPWRKKLHVNPSVYAECGGWTFDENGNRTELIYQDCYPIQKNDPSDNAVKVGKIREDLCPTCGCKLVDILTVDGKDKRLSFLGIDGKINIPVCPNCAGMCEKTIVHYTMNGESTMKLIEPFSEENYVSEKDLKALTSNKLSLSTAKQPVYYSCGAEELCTIGGHAEWVQDWQYEICPDCGKKMKLLAALAWGALLDGEGTLYVEICTNCCVVVTFHQQT